MRVLTLNIWDLPLIAKDIDSRMSAIREKIRNNDNLNYDYDVILFQELWNGDEFQKFQKAFLSLYPFSFHFKRPNSLMGSGLAIFSKYPLIGTQFFPFKINGYPLRIFDGDYFSDKGIAHTTIKHPLLGFIDLFTSHLVADYSSSPGEYDRYTLHRISQVIQIINLVSDEIKNPFIIGGDLNFSPDSIEYSLMMESIPYIKRTSPLFPTSDLIGNSYTSSAKKEEKIIDHIFFSSKLTQFGHAIPDFNGKYYCGGSGGASGCAAKNDFFSFSDHSGINCKFAIKDDQSSFNFGVKMFSRRNELMSIIIKERRIISSVGHVITFSIIASCILLYLFLHILSSSYAPIRSANFQESKKRIFYKRLMIIIFILYISFNVMTLKWNEFEKSIIKEIENFINQD